MFQTWLFAISTQKGSFVLCAFCALLRSFALVCELAFVWAPANPTRNPNPTSNNVFCSVHAMAENAEKLVVFCRFQSNEIQCTKHHRHKPATKQHEKHHKIRSKPNMKPQTQRETTASRSFITLGSTNSPRHETHPT